MTTLYLVRHAEALGNINGTFQGRTDCDITEKGVLQLKALSERFKDISIDKIYSSPLIRTVKTAQAVNFYHKLEIEIAQKLIEIDGGGFEGRKWEELPQLFPIEYNLWCNSFAEFEIEGGEKMTEVYERMTEVVTEIVAKNPNKSVVCVSHGCAIKNYLCYANNLPLSEVDKLGWSDNTAVSKLEFASADSLPVIVYQNDSSHLEEANLLSDMTWWRELTQNSDKE